MTHASIMDDLDTRAARESAHIRGVADGRDCRGERGGESCTSSEQACGACAGARGQRSPEENRKSKPACVMSSCGGGGFQAHKASYLSWRHVQASRSGSLRSSYMRRAHARVALTARGVAFRFRLRSQERVAQSGRSAPQWVRSHVAKSQAGGGSSLCWNP